MTESVRKKEEVDGVVFVYSVNNGVNVSFSTIRAYRVLHIFFNAS